ncbi:tyrosinase family protein [Peribacillus psychrosaccharolyticus]|nr:tyrosinase family protein [Peribacillus psychrosaccharolyticus]MEC2054071.1 tyrosinase family protein [Peribacillus psychrosaccharolyticus]MED3742309.1 tyrosinase family protein [Peribacillus psychrosaccharolyticus]
MSAKYKVRKNVIYLTDKEKREYVSAVLKLKEIGVYDRYVAWHTAGGKFQTPPRENENSMTEDQTSPTTNTRALSMSHGSSSRSQPNQKDSPVRDSSHRNAAHMGPAFLPWHREFLLRFESDLQKISPNIVLPYWDWATDAALKDPTNSPIWRNDFMGGNGNPDNDFIVESGPFAAGKWEVLDEDGSLAGSLKRNFRGSDQSLTLPTREDVRNVLLVTPYDTPSWDMTSKPSFRNQLEGFINGPQLHNRVHGWVGGHMGYVPTAPNDPVFFLHHANVDRLWAMWQIIHPEKSYEPRKGGPYGQNYTDRMFPWDTTPKDVINHRRLGYVYDVEIERARRKKR